jgi:hypothetical protein
MVIHDGEIKKLGMDLLKNAAQKRVNISDY